MAGFTLRDVPAAMRREGWPVGAQLMDRWFARSGWKMPDDIKRGLVAPPNFRADRTSVSMAWAMRVPRFASGQRNLLATWNRDERRQASFDQVAVKLREWIIARKLAGAPRFRFGNLARPVDWIDMHCAINREIVNSPILGWVDDFYAAFGTALVRLAVAGDAVRDGSNWRVSIDELGTYLRDSYEFNGDQRLGSWGPGGLQRASFLAPMIEVDERKGDASTSQQFWRVDNSSFEAYRRLTGTGGDYMIYSDLWRHKLDRPVVVTVRA